MPDASSSHRILVVDCDPIMRTLNTKILSDAGYHVDTAENHTVAWNMVQLNSYDLLITDHNRHVDSGTVLIKKMRAASIALPIIITTGGFPDDVFSQDPLLQSNAVLLKPYSVRELLQMVKRVLAKPPP